MPTYVYDILTPHGEPTGRTIEIFQSIKDSALAKHPDTGEPMRRAIVAPQIARSARGLTATGRANEDKRLGELGFTKYKNAGGGSYEKVVGDGPRTISPD